MADPKKTFPDPLVRNRTFPEPGPLFKFAPVSLDEALMSGIVAVDTNVLLVPYTTGAASMGEMRRTYEKLTQENRLRIPGQVAREFAGRRAEQIKILFQQISQKRTITLKTGKYPLLEGNKSYDALVECERQVEELLGKYRKYVGKLLDEVQSWQWNDPVSTIYREFFGDEIIVDPKVEPESLLKDVQYRQEHRIPPGYKDAGKEDLGVGDLLIWNSLLQIGRQEHRHLVFVSGDEKPDWRYQSENQTLYPRFELVDEYRRGPGGKTFLMISLAELLQKFGASAAVVKEVKQEEVGLSTAPFVASRASALRDFFAKWPQALPAETAVQDWLLTLFPSNAVTRKANGEIFLNGPGGSRKYHVRWVPSSDTAPAVIAATVLEARANSVGRSSYTGVVFVAPDIDIAAEVEYHASRMARWNNDPEILIGILDQNGNFFPTYSVDKRAKSTET